MSEVLRLRLAQGFIGLVLFFNIQSAAALIVTPNLYLGGFEVEGVAGIGMIRGIGILFIMWNIPYLVAGFNPQKYWVSLGEAIVMQTIGVVGETLLLQTVPINHIAIHSTINRFILFDGSGLLALIVAAWLIGLPKYFQKFPIRSTLNR